MHGNDVDTHIGKHIILYIRHRRRNTLDMDNVLAELHKSLSLQHDLRTHPLTMYLLVCLTHAWNCSVVVVAHGPLEHVRIIESKCV